MPASTVHLSPLQIILCLRHDISYVLHLRPLHNATSGVTDLPRGSSSLLTSVTETYTVRPQPPLPASFLQCPVPKPLFWWHSGTAGLWTGKALSHPVPWTYRRKALSPSSFSANTTSLVVFSDSESQKNRVNQNKISPFGFHSTYTTPYYCICQAVSYFTAYTPLSI